MRAGPTRPPTGHRWLMGGIHTHRLYVGTDEHTFIGPQRSLAGGETALELIRETARELGVSDDRVICAGTSGGAALALCVGLPYGAGRIVAGAPPFRIGAALARF